MTDLKVVDFEAKTQEKELTYLDRMEIELEELKDKLVNLNAFLDSEAKAPLSSVEIQLMVQQLKSMGEYMMLLEARIALYEDEED